MKKTALVMLSILVFVTVAAYSVKPSHASIQATGWIQPDYRGYDQYYDQSVVAYEGGTNWQLSVMIQNNWGPPMDQTQINISTIIVYFTWGKNYTHRYTTPQAIPYGEVMTFTVSNRTPTTSEVPELWTYEYWMYVEMVNATSGALEVVGTWTRSAWDYDFAVYSSNHLNSQQLYNKLQTLFGMGPMFPWNISKAMVLYIQAYFEYQLGYQAYNTGDFESSGTHFTTADDLFGQTLTVTDERGTAIEDSALNATRDNSQANLINANAAMTNAYGWMMFGLGWILIGVGVIVYGARKPKPPPP